MTRVAAGRVRSTARADPFAAAAAAVAERLLDTAVAGPHGPAWTGDDLRGHDAASLELIHTRVGSDLYGGTAGIGWFLAHAAAWLRSDDMGDLARSTLRGAVMQASSAVRAAPGLYSGAAGAALAAVDAGEVLSDVDLKTTGHQLGRRIASVICAESNGLTDTDLISGSAGVLVALLALQRGSGDERLLAACRRLLDDIRSRALDRGAGLCWCSDTSEGLCGLGHGASGIAWALAEAGWLMNDTEVASLAEQAWRYERAWFAPDLSEWADLREYTAAMADAATPPARTTAWCHGALGIGAVRLRSYEATGDLTALAEAGAAIQAARQMVGRAAHALRAGQVSDVTLCHGLGGAAELMLLAHEVTGLEDHRRAARRVGQLCLDIHAANGRQWTCGLQKAMQVPGLFLGEAGIGVTMLRLHDPTRIGSPLLAGRRAPGTHMVVRQASGSA